MSLSDVVVLSSARTKCAVAKMAIIRILNAALMVKMIRLSGRDVDQRLLTMENGIYDQGGCGCIFEGFL